ncbi:MAG: hypothetical protein HBSAPP02_04480 [Phycisphaerae bacterium]|nr:MAG: hypothetical protein HRU71_11235 [Planctomycetia bacterium]RIK71723.1 MAG: hypothetical protein DCC66_00325 [Planctomycetota bacterium]GJQ25416.1 MAG: hypothetical protein HBSAPP02_04480 [Phycisphaerae bacterium]
MPSKWLASIGRIPWRRIASASWRAFRRTIPRVYALALGALIGYLTFAAVRYLIVSLAIESGPPPQIAALPTRLDAATLSAGRSAFAALDAAEHPRSPLAHYHRLDSWIAPDAYNDCSRSGCHAPLPHARDKELRAFLNMHASSMHCGVCHFDHQPTPLKLAWYDLQSGQARGTPALLDAYGMVLAATAAESRGAERPTPHRTDPSFDQDRANQLGNLLNQAADAAGGSRSLKELARHIAAVRPGSPAMAKLLDAAREELPRHFRGEYGAKLAVVDRDGKLLRGHPNTEQAKRNYLEAVRRAAERIGAGASPSSQAVTTSQAVDVAPRPDTGLSQAERDSLLAAVHPLRRKQPRTCTECHRSDQSLIDFKAIGMPGPRVDALVNPVVFRMIEHIGQGRSFGLPEFMRDNAESRGNQRSNTPTSQPVERLR